jgi:chromosome segregation ATPase
MTTITAQWIEAALNSKYVEKGVELLVSQLLGNCHQTGAPGGDPNCQCVVCRAFRTEKAENQVTELTKNLASSVDERDGATSAAASVLDDIQKIVIDYETTKRDLKNISDNLAVVGQALGQEKSKSYQLEAERNKFKADLENHVSLLSTASDKVTNLSKELTTIKSTLKGLL